MSIESYYRTGFSVKRPVSVSDSGGSFTTTFADYAAISGRMRPLTGTEILANEKLGLKTSHRFYCAVLSAVESDRIYDSVNDKTYEIRFIKNPMEMDDHLEIDCELIDA